MIPKRICLLALFLLVPFLASGQTYQTDSGHAEFTGHTPLFSFEGSSDSLRGTVNVSERSVEFKLPLQTIDTGNNKRNRDMRDKLEVEKYPYAKFEGKITSSINPGKTGKQKVTAKGKFTVHGTSQSLKIPGTIQLDKNQLTIAASWSAKLTDYNMEPPSVSFYSMDNEIEIRIEGVLKPAVTSN